MGLPAGLSPSVDSAKIERYLLDLSSVDGAAKAKFFMAHGFAAADPAALAGALVRQALAQTLTSTVPGPYETKYRVDCRLVSPDGRDPCVSTIWITEDGFTARLVTAYPNS